MLQSQNMSLSLNPWAFHLQKLGLELKCPLCLNLLNKPILLPCSHIFCEFCIPKSPQFGSECPACQNHFTDQERRPAPFLENIVAIYRSLNATFNATILPLFSSDSGKELGCSPVLVLTSAAQLQRKPNETAALEGHQQANASPSIVNCVQDDSSEKMAEERLLSDDRKGKVERQCGMVLKDGDKVSPLQSSEWKDNLNTLELDVNQASELSPGSFPSFGDAKYADGCSDDMGSRNGKPDGNNLDTAGDGIDSKAFLQDAFERDAKRQKKLNYGPSGELLQSNEETEFREDSPITPSTTLSDTSNINASVCAFCHLSRITDWTGPIIQYVDGKEVIGSLDDASNAIPVHRKCIEWSPQVYYAGETIMNLEPELARAAKLKCKGCGLKGAALGCFAKSCRRSYHVPCALKIPDCRWDCDDFLLLCPVHKSTKFPSEKFRSKKRARDDHHSVPTPTSSDQLATSPNGAKELVFCGSALSSKEKHLLYKFATLCGATVTKMWSPNVTHVIAATDAKGACCRSLKFLMAILNGSWILTMDWVKASLEANCPVNEEPYEVNLDNHGFRNGPKNGRLRALTNAPKIFEDFKFYFSEDFVLSYKNDLVNLVTVGGGVVIEGREQLIAERHNEQAVSTYLVVYNQDSPLGCLQRFEEAENIAIHIGSLDVPHTWILETIAASALSPSTSYRPNLDGV